MARPELPVDGESPYGTKLRTALNDISDRADSAISSLANKANSASPTFTGTAIFSNATLQKSLVTKTVTTAHTVENAAITIDASSGNNQTITLAANAGALTVNNPTVGQYLTITWQQNGTGGWRYKWPSTFFFANQHPPTVSYKALARDIVTFVYDGANWIEKSRSADTRLVGGRAAFGDSLTAAGSYMTQVASVLGVPTIFNGGVSGYTSTEAAIRQGGIRLALTASTNLIPASGSVTVTVSPTGSFRTTGASFSWTGTLCGIPGTLLHDTATADVWTFTRTTGGTAKTLPPGSIFYTDIGNQYNDRTQYLWVGRNNIDDQANILRDVAAMVKYLKSQQRRYLVLSVTNASNEILGGLSYGKIMAINAALAQEYGERYVDVRSYLIENGLADAGITPTTQDNTDIANDTIPSSLHIDSIHFTTAGYQAIGNCVAAAERRLGWSAG